MRYSDRSMEIRTSAEDDPKECYIHISWHEYWTDIYGGYQLRQALTHFHIQKWPYIALMTAFDTAERMQKGPEFMKEVFGHLVGIGKDRGMNEVRAKVNGLLSGI
jgi:hypothetical protein